MNDASYLTKMCFNPQAAIVSESPAVSCDNDFAVPQKAGSCSVRGNTISLSLMVSNQVTLDQSGNAK